MTRAMKENTPFRIAFCVLCHKYTPVLAELVHQLDAPGNGLFIHVDGKADIGAFAALGKTGRVCFVEPRTKVYWGGFGMVESTLRLFSATRDGGFRYVVLISGDTLPKRYVRYSGKPMTGDGNSFRPIRPSPPKRPTGYAGGGSAPTNRPSPAACCGSP